MAVAAARRAQMTPSRYAFANGGVEAVPTPAKRLPSSSAVASDSTPVKRQHILGSFSPDWNRSMIPRSPLGVQSQQWHQHKTVLADVDEDPLYDNAMAPTGRHLPLGSDPVRGRPPFASHLQSSRQQPFIATALGGARPFDAKGKVNLHGIRGQQMIGQVAAQQQPIANDMMGNQQESCAGMQLRTPSRPNSAGSALRGYVPPEHR